MKKCASLVTVLICCYAVSRSQPCTIPNSFFADDTIVVCQGNIYQLNAPLIPAAAYTWSTAAVSNSITITNNGKYWLQISDGICTQSDTVTVLFNSFLLSPQVNDLKLCKGQPSLPLPVR